MIKMKIKIKFQIKIKISITKIKTIYNPKSYKTHKLIKTKKIISISIYNKIKQIF